MEKFIVIREYRTNDKEKCSNLIYEAVMSNVRNAFAESIFREITFQLIVLTAAIMFIFMGVPVTFCLISIPVSIVIIYISIYNYHWMKAMELNNEPASLKCWVAEVYEPLLFFGEPRNTSYTIINNECSIQNVELTKYRRKIIATISVDKHKHRGYSAWIRKFAVDKTYRRKGIGSAVLNIVLRHCQKEQYESLELVITECQDIARQMFNKAGFDLVQVYHKKFLVASVQKYHFGLEICSSI